MQTGTKSNGVHAMALESQSHSNGKKEVINCMAWMRLSTYKVSIGADHILRINPYC